MMKTNRANYLKYIMSIMILANFIIIAFIQFIMVHVVNHVNREGSARILLSHMDAMPYQVHRVAYITMILFLILVVVMQLKNRINDSQSLFLGILILELILSIVIVRYTSIGYNGIILLVVADIATIIDSRYEQIVFLLCMSIVYIISNYSVQSMLIPQAAFTSFLIIYPNTLQSIILGVKEILIGINLICFILYMIIMTRNQMKEKEKIKALNTELKIVNEELVEANEKLKDYASIQKQLGETEERNRIAREIHDTLGHSMTGLAAGLDACRMLIDVSVPDTKKQIMMLADVAREGLQDIRRSVNKLRPDALEHYSLDYAIRKLIRQNVTVSNVKIDYLCDIEEMKFNPDEEDIVFRIVQEAMTNAIRHGRANVIVIHIWEDDTWVHITIQDNGCGCDEIHSGFGLKHMEERIEMLQGQLAFEGKNGFTVMAKIPVRWK